MRYLLLMQCVYVKRWKWYEKETSGIVVYHVLYTVRGPHSSPVPVATYSVQRAILFICIAIPCVQTIQFCVHVGYTVPVGLWRANHRKWRPVKVPHSPPTSHSLNWWHMYSDCNQPADDGGGVGIYILYLSKCLQRASRFHQRIYIRDYSLVFHIPSRLLSMWLFPHK